MDFLAAVIWTSLQIHQDMKDLVKLGIKKTPVMAAEFIHFLTKSTASDKNNILLGRFKALEKNLGTLQSMEESVDTTVTLVNLLKGTVGSLQRAVAKLEIKKK